MPKFVAGDNVYVGDVLLGAQTLADLGLDDLGLLTAPAASAATLDATKKIVTIPYSKPIFQVDSTAAALKAKVTVATDGTTFGALGASDTVTIVGSALIVTFNEALTLATNKVKVAASTVQDANGLKNAVFTTAALDASE